MLSSHRNAFDSHGIWHKVTSAIRRFWQYSIMGKGDIVASKAEKSSDQALIPNAMESVRARLDQFLANTGDNGCHRVVTSNLFDQHGSLLPNAENRVVMTLVNITHETTVSNYARQPPGKQPGRQGDFVSKSPPLYVNLHLLFYANFADNNYGSALEAISDIIGFFQQHPVFTQETLPDLDPRIDKLTFEYQNLDFAELKDVMGLIGARYLPSALYKLRALPFAGDAVPGDAVAVAVGSVEE